MPFRERAVVSLSRGVAGRRRDRGRRSGSPPLPFRRRHAAVPRRLAAAADRPHAPVPRLARRHPGGTRPPGRHRAQRRESARRRLVGRRRREDLRRRRGVPEPSSAPAPRTTSATPGRSSEMFAHAYHAQTRAGRRRLRRRVLDEPLPHPRPDPVRAVAALRLRESGTGPTPALTLDATASTGTPARAAKDDFSKPSRRPARVRAHRRLAREAQARSPGDARLTPAASARRRPAPAPPMRSSRTHPAERQRRDRGELDDDTAHGGAHVAEARGSSAAGRSTDMTPTTTSRIHSDASRRNPVAQRRRRADHRAADAKRGEDLPRAVGLADLADRRHRGAGQHRRQQADEVPGPEAQRPRRARSP